MVRHRCCPWTAESQHTTTEARCGDRIMRQQTSPTIQEARQIHQILDKCLLTDNPPMEYDTPHIGILLQGRRTCNVQHVASVTVLFLGGRKAPDAASHIFKDQAFRLKQEEEITTAIVSLLASRRLQVQLCKLHYKAI